jgi:hypothetical protein
LGAASSRIHVLVFTLIAIDALLVDIVTDKPIIQIGARESRKILLPWRVFKHSEDTSMLSGPAEGPCQRRQHSFPLKQKSYTLPEDT